MTPARFSLAFICFALLALAAPPSPADPTKPLPATPANDSAIVRVASGNLMKNPAFDQRDAADRPIGYTLSGEAEARNLSDRQDVAGWGVILWSGPWRGFDAGHSGSVSQIVAVDPSQGRWCRFSFRGLPQDHFLVGADDDLYMKAEFFGNKGKTPYDGKAKPLYAIVERARKDMTANGDFHVGGAAVWTTYELDFYIPFPQVDSVRLSVGFTHGQGTGRDAGFEVSNFSLVRLAGAPEVLAAAPTAQADPDKSNLISLGGRWYYAPPAKGGSRDIPARFDYTNVDRLLYFDGHYTAPFLGNTSTWLRAGDKDVFGNIVTRDIWIPDNVTLEIQGSSLVIHSKGLPNHPTGKFPQPGRGGNPNYITEQNETYYIPLNPMVNPNHIITTKNNSNHALNMGPIGIALNGVVFFNPFDAGSMDASSLMDCCCGHPNQDGLYHYHKYPVCIHSPWADEGNAHSPLIGFAFDGFPIYGPYESANLMAKDVTGKDALNGFNIQYDADRGWHYHVTPGKFPYLIGGYWGYVDHRDTRPPHRGGGMNGRRVPGGGFGPGAGPPPSP